MQLAFDCGAPQSSRKLEACATLFVTPLVTTVQELGASNLDLNLEVRVTLLSRVAFACFTVRLNIA